MAQYDGSIRINTKIDTKNASSQLMSLENRIVKTADKITSLRSKMDSLKNAKIPTQEYSEISAQIQKAEVQFNKLLEKQEQMQRDGKDNGVAWERLNTKIEEVGNTIKYAKGELKDLVDTGRAFTLGSNTQEYANLGQQLQYAENDLAALSQRQNELISKNNTAKMSFEKLGASVKKAFSSTSSWIRNATLSMFGFGKSAKGTNNILNSGFKNILKYGLGIRSLYALVNKFRAGVKTGFGNLAQYSAPVNAALSSLKSALTQLSNSLATCL